MILYGRRQGRAARCLWTIEELGLPYRQVPIDSQNGENRTADFLAINPSGKVPVLDDDGFILRESLAINYHLAVKVETPLWPDDRRRQSLIHQWSSWAATEIEPPLAMVFHDRRRAAATDGEPSATLSADCNTLVANALNVIEEHLHSNPYVVGDSFTLGDINACSMIMLAPMLLDMSVYPSIQAWTERCAARPAWRRVQALP